MAGLIGSIGQLIDSVAKDAKKSSMIPFVIVLGRPGAGKSEFYNQAKMALLERKYNCVRLDDVRDLKAMARGELDGAKYVTPKPGGGFVVKDPSVFDVVLKRMCSQAKKSIVEGSKRSRRRHGLSAAAPADPETLVIMEFARSDNINALVNNFTPDVLDSSLIVYLNVSVQKSLERTDRRHLLKNRTVSMDHQVPPEVIEQFYATDDRDAVLVDKHFQTYLIDNDEDDIEAYKKEVHSVLDRVLDGRFEDDKAAQTSAARLAALQAREAAAKQDQAAIDAKMAKYREDLVLEDVEEDVEEIDMVGDDDAK